MKVPQSGISLFNSRYEVLNAVDGTATVWALLVGARGAGKTLVLDSALKELRKVHGERVLLVRLNGMGARLRHHDSSPHLPISST